MSTDSGDIIKVSGSSSPQAVGSILARAVVAGQSPKMRAIGASAEPGHQGSGHLQGLRRPPRS